MIPYDRETLFRVAQWTMTSKRNVGRKIRELAGTRETCTLILTELYRISDHLQTARSVGAPATLTLVDWFTALEYFHWLCAYCQTRPFQVLHHLRPNKQAGTTPENCVPACRHCCHSPSREYAYVQVYLAMLQKQKNRLGE